MFRSRSQEAQFHVFCKYTTIYFLLLQNVFETRVSPQSMRYSPYFVVVVFEIEENRESRSDFTYELRITRLIINGRVDYSESNDSAQLARFCNWMKRDESLPSC